MLSSIREQDSLHKAKAAVHVAFPQILDQRGLTTWHGLRRQALDAVRSNHGPEPFDGVVVDEVQDLDPTVLRLLVMLCAAPNRCSLQQTRTNPSTEVHLVGPMLTRICALGGMTEILILPLD